MNAKRGFVPEDEGNFSPEAVRRSLQKLGEPGILVHEGKRYKRDPGVGKR